MDVQTAELPRRATDRVAVAPRLLTGLRYGLRSRLATLPSYINFATAGRHRDEVVRPTTKIVIDGFPRSANTFATIAFQTAQGTPVQIAHHLHAAAQLIAGVRLGIPTVILVREPADAAVSEAIRAYPVPLRQVLAAYCRFYASVIPYLRDMAVGEFRTVTSDFGSVIRKLNRHFSTHFDVFDHGPASVNMVFKLIEERERRRNVKLVDDYLAGRLSLDGLSAALNEYDRRGVPATLHENAVSRPSADRSEAKAQLTKELNHPGMADLVRRANALYDRVVSYE